MLKEIPILKILRAEIAQKNTLKEILINFKKTEEYGFYRNDVELLQNIISWIYDADLVKRYYTREEIAAAFEVINEKQYYASIKEELIDEMANCECY